MKRIFTILFILISLIGYSQETTQDFIKVDPITLGVQQTTTITYSRDYIETRIDEYNRTMESVFAERQKWVDMLEQCNRLDIISTTDTLPKMMKPLDAKFTPKKKKK